MFDENTEKENPPDFPRENISIFCSFCLSQVGNLLDIDSPTAVDSTYRDFFRYLLNEEEKSVLEVPRSICQDCAGNLISACNFKKRSLRNIKYFKSKEFVDDESPLRDEECAGTTGFTCGECGKILSTRGSLKSHLSRHRHGNEYKCAICQEVFQNFNARKRHVNLIHFNRKIHQCPFCEESFQYHSTHREHIRKVHEKEQDVECPLCPKKFFSDKELGRHKLIHDFVPKCEDCGKIYKDIRALKKHMRILHKISKYQPPQLMVKEMPEPERVGKKTFSCEKCQKDFKGPINLEKHLRTVHREWLCTECGKIIKGTSYSVHMSSHTESPQVCPECGRTLSSPGALRKHQKRVHGPKVTKNYDCPHCELQFVSPHTRRYHVAKLHTRKPLYTCHCGQEFLYHHVYKRHVRRDHTGEFPYACEMCPKKFLTLAECRRHRQSHSNERSFKCRTCEKDFKTDVALYIHMKSHRRVEG
ncbi:zinc finger protein 664-like [Phlebotomus argentipes]|uniref:zinc finger protein 664-like n=1 Tax=Phlebotomus argentipes TaxID=94469 RepID=UPI0028933722|nr:zinc finger protein 664-like [Phlebotomus argentipes]